MKKRNQDDQTNRGRHHKSDDVRGTKRKPEDEGEREDAKGQHSVMVSCLSEEELTRRDIHEAVVTRGKYFFGNVEDSEDKNATMVMDVPIKEDFEQELARAWDDIDGQELDPETVKKARAVETEWCWKMNVYVTRPVEECFEKTKKTKKPPNKVEWVDHNKGDRQKVNVRSRLGSKADQHRQGTRVVRGNAVT